MPEQAQLIPIALDDTAGFACHPAVPCFNHCCRDLTQALMPYDVLRLKNHFGTSANDFIARYAHLFMGEATGLPVVSLRFSDDAEKNCPFVGPQGCRVYGDRPSSCRIYPLARGLQRSRQDGRLIEQYALIREPHCKGFAPDITLSVREWIASQDLAPYHHYNDMLLDVIALKNQTRPGPLSGEQFQLAKMAMYDIDQLKVAANDNQLPEIHHAHLQPLPQPTDDEGWLAWAMSWVVRALFGKDVRHLPYR